jgi:ubiquinone/menaquinone biosynthesis C-methylase UbiE
MSKSNRDLREYHERHMTNGQDCLFNLEEGKLHVRPKQRHWLKAHLKKMMQMLDLKPTDQFVDLGCGEGYFTLPLAQQVAHSVGVDFAATALKVVKGQQGYKQRKLSLTIASGESIPLVSASVDKLLCNHILEHVLDDDAVMQEVHRVVRPCGLVLIGVPLELAPQIRLTLFLRRTLFPRAHKPQLERAQPGHLVPELVGRSSHIRFYSLLALRHLLERNGFRVLRAEGIGLSLRGRPAALFRHNSLLFGFSTAFGYIVPSIGAGVLMLAERLP